jgi:ribonuclease BN (tRNA processing enzyme)
VKVTAAENSHFHFPPESAAYGKHQSYSYRFEAPARVVVFTGDTGPSDAVINLAKNADVLVTEIGSVDDVVEARKGRGQWDVFSEGAAGVHPTSG